MNNRSILTISLTSALLIAIVGATTPNLANVAYGHDCRLPNPDNDLFPGNTPHVGNCPAGEKSLNGQDEARGLIGQEQNNNPENNVCKENLPDDACDGDEEEVSAAEEQTENEEDEDEDEEDEEDE